MSAANRRLAQQLANRPGVNQVGGGNAAAVMYQQQQQMMMGGGQGRGAGGARGGRGALRGAGAIKVSQQFYCNYVGISLSFIGFLEYTSHHLYSHHSMSTAFPLSFCQPCFVNTCKLIVCWWKRETESFLPVICEFSGMWIMRIFPHLHIWGGGGGGGSQFRTLDGHISHI